VQLRPPIVVANLNPSVDYVLHVPAWQQGRTVRVRKTACYAGGKGANVGRAFQSLGESVETLNLLAGRMGQLWVDLLEAEGIHGSHIRLPEGQTRINVTILTDGMGEQETHLIDAGPTVSPSCWDLLIDRLRETIANASCLVLTGSLPPGLPQNAYGVLIQEAGGVPVCLDTSGQALAAALSSAPSLVKPNQQEAENLFGKDLRGKEDWLWAVQELWNRGVQMATISLGEGGAVLGWKGEIWWGRIPLSRVVSTVGCGDAFLAGMVYGYLRDDDPGSVLSRALALGAACALEEVPGHIGCQAVEALKVLALMERWD